MWVTVPREHGHVAISVQPIESVIWLQYVRDHGWWESQIPE